MQENQASFEEFVVPEGIDESELRARAACRDSDEPAIFFPKRGENWKFEVAIAICQECPVKRTCLIYGFNQKHGIWGGLSEKQRRKLRKKGIDPRSIV